jgi:hypothetical protein
MTALASGHTQQVALNVRNGDAIEDLEPADDVVADEAEGIEEVRGHFVGAALAAVERKERGANALSAGLVSELAAILVIGMRGDHDEAGAGVELIEGLPESGGAPVDGDFAIVGGLGQGNGDRDERDEEPARSPPHVHQNCR